MKLSLLLSLSIGLVVSSNGYLMSADKEAQAKFKSLIRGMLAARQKVRSGEVRVEGTKTALDEKGGLLNGELKGRYRFDTSNNSYAWKWVYPRNLIIKPEGTHNLPNPGPPMFFHVHYWACRNPKYFAEAEDIPGSNPHLCNNLNLRPPKDDFREKGGFCRQPPVDPLGAGVVGYFEYLRGKSAADVYQGMLPKTVESYDIKGTTVTILLKDKVVSHTLVVDQEKMVPLQLTSCSLTDPSVFTSKAKWKTIDGTIVPVEIADSSRLSAAHRRKG